MTYPKRTLAASCILLLLVLGFSVFQKNTVTAQITGINSSLTLWDSSIYSALYVNDSVTFYANYTSENGTVQGDCNIVSDSFNETMQNESIYIYQHHFAVAGKYSYAVYCSKENYQSQTAHSIVQIEDLPVIDSDAV